MRAVARLPWGMQRMLGRAVGGLLYQLMRRRRRIAETNLALCFPELPDSERTRIVRRHFRSLGIGLIEIAIAWWGREEQVAPRARILGAEHLEAALSEGKGVLLLSGHFTTFEIGGRILASRYTGGATYRPNNDPWWDAVIRGGRNRYLSDLLGHKDVRGMVRYLGQNRILWYAPDQNSGGSRSVFARFFAERAATTTATAWLAKTSGARVVPFLSYRRADESGWDVVLSPALEGYPSGDDLTDAERLNAVLEAGIERCIDQYLWIHRRFRTRPPGAPPAYHAELLRRTDRRSRAMNP